MENLTGRAQRVVVYDATGKIVHSDETPGTSRVPQGAIMGLMLFGIYINNYPTHMKNQ